MQDDGTDHRDSYDTLYVPFVWVPDGAPRPTEWLARHPEAFWVPARLVRNRPTVPNEEGEAGSGQVDQSAGHNDPIGGEDRFTSPGPPLRVNPRRRTTACWLTAQGIGREDPVASYLRINAYLTELGAERPVLGDERNGEAGIAARKQAPQTHGVPRQYEVNELQGTIYNETSSLSGAGIYDARVAIGYVAENRFKAGIYGGIAASNLGAREQSAIHAGYPAAVESFTQSGHAARQVLEKIDADPTSGAL